MLISICYFYLVLSILLLVCPRHLHVCLICLECKMFLARMPSFYSVFIVQCEYDP